MGAYGRHHYVPQFYLRRFSQDGASVSVLLVDTMRVIQRASLKGQSQRHHFYGAKPDLEQALSELEGEISGALAQLDGAPEKFSEEVRVHLLTFVAVQRGRTPAGADELAHFQDDLFRTVAKTHPDPEIRATADMVHIRPVEPGVQSVLMAAEAGGILLDLEIKLCINSTSLGFITSDHPVVCVNPWAPGETAFARSGLVIVVPLSSKMLLTAYDGRVYKVGHARKRVVSVANEEDVRAMNVLQWRNASECLYAATPAFPLPRRLPKRHERTSVRTVAREVGPNRYIVGGEAIGLRAPIEASFFEVRRGMSKHEKDLGPVRNPGLLELIRSRWATPRGPRGA